MSSDQINFDLFNSTQLAIPLVIKIDSQLFLKPKTFSFIHSFIHSFFFCLFWIHFKLQYSIHICILISVHYFQIASRQETTITSQKPAARPHHRHPCLRRHCCFLRRSPSQQLHCHRSWPSMVSSIPCKKNLVVVLQFLATKRTFCALCLNVLGFIN